MGEEKEKVVRRVDFGSLSLDESRHWNEAWSLAQAVKPELKHIEVAVAEFVGATVWYRTEGETFLFNRSLLTDQVSAFRAAAHIAAEAELSGSLDDSIQMLAEMMVVLQGRKLVTANAIDLDTLKRLLA
jgi:hypothetical protein